ncbi:uncharacterized protein [Anabrus simplex]|uniref:uncharacterized protein n=1 Tax=Anabrus simplex TaxID=316456 RepID=UPI0034DCD56E
MRLIVSLLALAVAVVPGLADERVKRQAFFHPQQVTRGPPPPPPKGVSFTGAPLTRFPVLSNTSPQAFRSAPVDENEDNINAVTPSVAPLLISRPQPQPTGQPQFRRPVPQDTQIIPVRGGQPPQGRRPGPPQKNQFGQAPQEELEEELEEEKPDRLSLLLPQSKFDCNGKKTGYYADDGLGCEVFHYCQDNAKHSWICPEGFVFHQVHLICMPPSGDNICKQSSQFHFVNDYLYLPINEKEVQNKPNVTLRYSDRYYPDSFYEEGDQRPAVPRQQVVAGAPLQGPPQQQQQRGRPLAPQVFRQPGPNQVFHSPEEVNIPLLQRRPQGGPPQHRGGFPSHDDDDFEYDDGGSFRQG